MPKLAHALRTAFFTLALSFLLILVAPSAFTTILYKQYTIQRDHGWDILCEPYIVQKDDYVSKLLKQKGDIAGKDHPEFFGIFMRLNPHIRNVDHIRPGQEILIPLKKLPPGSMPGQASGIVTIPFLKISKTADLIKDYATVHTVKKGECVSALLSRKFGPYQSPAYQEGVELFQKANPHIKNINLIYPGQKLFIPDPAIRHEPWYASLFSPAETDGAGLAPTSAPPAPSIEEPRGPLDQVASVLGAALLKKGKYFFPREDGKDVMFDLARYPVMEFADNTRIVLVRETRGEDAGFDVVKSHWPHARFVQVEPDASPQSLLRAVLAGMDIQVTSRQLTFLEQGVQVTFASDFVFPKPVAAGAPPVLLCIMDPAKDGLTLPDSIRRYLAQKNIQVAELAASTDSMPENAEAAGTFPLELPEEIQILQASEKNAFLQSLAPALGCRYSQKVHISFPYAGVQVSALANLLTDENGAEYVVDFGNLYGEAVSALERSGLGVIQFGSDDNSVLMIQKLKEALDLKSVVDPAFTLGNPEGNWHLDVKIPGFLLMTSARQKVLLAVIPVPSAFIGYLNSQEIKVLQLAFAEKTDSEYVF